jgi:ATP-binding cassette subfamily C (CFTR/MRP) protein 3
MNRIQKFLNEEELDPDCVTDQVNDPGDAVQIEGDGTFSWDTDTPPVLHK